MQDISIESKEKPVVVTKTKKKKKPFGVGNFLFSWIIKAIILASFLGADFLLFASSGSYNIFNLYGMVNLEVVYIVSAIFAISLLLMFLLSFANILQDILLAVVVGYLSLIFMSQFGAFDAKSVLSLFIFPHPILDVNSHILIACGFGISMFLLLGMTSKKSQFYFAATLLVCLSTMVSCQYITCNINDTFVVLKEEANKNTQDGKKLVYISFEGMPSVNSVKSLDEKLAHTMLGFYEHNNFSLYPNAFVQNLGWEENLIKSLNLSSNLEAKEYLQKDVLVDGYWDFHKINDEKMFLKENQLFDVLKKAKYSIKAYQNNGLNFCKVNNSFAVDKCTDMQTISVALEAKNFSLKDKTILLLAQWLESMNVNPDMSFVYGMFKPLIHVNDIPLIGKSYKEFYVINSLEALDRFFVDIRKDKGNNAYFIHINLPNNLYIYDENCKVKKLKDWDIKNNYPWVDSNPALKEKAFASQSICVFNKLQDLLDNTKSDNTVFILQSNSGIRGLSSDVSKDYIKGFKEEKLVTFAIKDPLNDNFSIDNEICLSNLLLRKYLFKRNDCSQADLNLQDQAKQDLVKDLMQPLDALLVKSKDVYLQGYEKYKIEHNPALKLQAIKANLPLIEAKEEFVAPEKLEEVPLKPEAVSIAKPKS